MNKKALLSFALLLTGTGSIALADWIDDIAVAITTTNTWNASTIENCLQRQVNYDAKRVQILNDQKEGKKGFLGSISKAALSIELTSAERSLSLHKKALNKLREIAKDAKWQNELIPTFREITCLNARIKDLEDKGGIVNKTKAGALRAELMIKKTYVEKRLEW